MSRGQMSEPLTITLTRREWVKICASLAVRTGVDPKAGPLLEKLHPVVIQPLIAVDLAADDEDGGRRG